MFRNAYGRLTGLVLAVAAVLLLTTTTSAQSTKTEKAAVKPPIEITTIPRAGAGPVQQDLIAGRVNIANPGNYKVCIFSHTDRWYVEPYVAAPLTDINPSDGRWQARIFLGEEYAALLVRPSYKPPATTLTLPSIGSDIIAIAREAARR